MKMTQKQRQTFNAAIIALGAVYRQKIEPVQLEGYWSLLQDLSLEQFLFGIKDAGKVCKFMPVPAEIRTHAKDYTSPSSLAITEGDGVTMPPEVRKRLDVLLKKISPTFGHQR